MRDLADDELARELAHARNKRDAFAAGREPAEVRARLLALLREQERRRHASRVRSYEATLEMIASRRIRSATKDDIVLAEEV